MAIFISYSHQDREFVDRLATRLAEERVHIWLDRMELKIGDSLVQRIQEAIQGASAIIVVLSSASVESLWCRREVTAVLVRELEERKVLALPLLIQDCETPLFLRDKLRADFRVDFDEGIQDVLKALAPWMNPHRGRSEEGPEVLIDWALDWFEEDHFYRRITIVEHGPHRPSLTITEIHIHGDRQATKFHEDYANAGLDWWSEFLVFELLASTIPRDWKVVLRDQRPLSQRFEGRDDKLQQSYRFDIQTRWLGQDDGNESILHLGNLIHTILDDQRSITRKLTPDERAKVSALRLRRGVKPLE